MPDNNDIYFPKMLSITLIFLSILFFIPDVVMYKIMKIGPIQASVAILFFPFVYSITDSITEVYGRDKTFIVLIACYLISLFFSIVVKWAIQLPSTSDWQHQQSFNIVFGNGPLIICAGFLSVCTSMYVNVKLMSGMKRKMRGKHFIIRSMISSSIGELIVTGIAYPVVFYATPDSSIKLMLNAYLFKIAYSVIGAFPARFLVFLLREIDGIKQDDFNKDFFNYSKKN